MMIRKLLPELPWEILEVPNTWKPISKSMAKFLLEDQKRDRIEKEIERVRKKISDSGSVHKPSR